MFSKFAASIVLAGAIMPALLPGRHAPTTERSRPQEAGSVFENRMADYVDLHRECVRRLRQSGVDHASNGGGTFQVALRRAIRRARRGARPGDILSPALAPQMLHLLQADLATRDRLDREAIFAEVPQLPVRVNERYPPGAPLATMPPLLLLRLPPLAPEVQYRFLGRTLILLDVDANLIVDVMPDALPDLL